MIKNSNYEIIYIDENTSAEEIKSFFNIDSDNLNALYKEGERLIEYQVNNQIIKPKNYYAKNNKGEIKLIGNIFVRSKDYSF